MYTRKAYLRTRSRRYDRWNMINLGVPQVGGCFNIFHAPSGSKLSRSGTRVLFVTVRRFRFDKMIPEEELLSA